MSITQRIRRDSSRREAGPRALGAVLQAVLIASIPPLAAASSAVDDRPTTEVGVARVDVTPDYAVRLNGYGARDGESKGVAQRLWAKGLAIGSDAEGARLLICVDNLGVPDAIVEEVAARLKSKAGIARDHFVVSSSHTHSAPCVAGSADNLFGKKLADAELATIARYTRELTDRLEEVGLEALRARRPARLSWAQGRAGFAANRRPWPGPVDHALPVLRAIDPDGSVRAVVVGYACHCTTVDPRENTFHGDWAGVAQEEIEKRFPGAIALTVVGCGADADPSPRIAAGSVESNGKAIAAEVERLSAGPWTDLAGPPASRFKRVRVPFDVLPTRAELEAMAAKGGARGYNARTMLDRLDRGEPLQEALDYPVQTWTFGDDLVMVFLAGEVVVDYALRLKAELDERRVWVVAYSNDVPCYIPSERVLREGGYEGGEAMIYYARPTRLKSGVEDLIVSTALDLVPDPSFRTVAPKAVDDAPPPRSPEESLRSIRIKPGLRVELAAAEPMVVDPVSIDFGADGTLWVCEMRDYPRGIDGAFKPGGVIKALKDRDGDGRYDEAVEFLRDVPFPTGVTPWRKGVLVCSAPDVIYAEDVDGDGAADVRKVLFTGFSTENYQGRVNGLTYNLDNWVYGANGLTGGVIEEISTGRKIPLGGRDFRIRPDDGLLETASGLSQSGRVHDDWGAQFGNNNSNWLFHFPMPDHAARRNPWVSAPAAVVDVPRHAESHRIHPISRTLERYNDPHTANHTTSACGPSIYRDDLLGPEYQGNAFTCEPVHNVVHREVLTPVGATFAGRRADDEQGSEFLASTDNWFRPVQTRTGPDGALYVVDMYRFVIEHPRWIGPDRLAKLDVRAGDDKGRIYRIVPEGRPLRVAPNLDRRSTPELAALIDSRNGTLRDNVQRTLVHRGDRSAAPTLEAIARGGTYAEGRAQALGALDGLGVLEAATVRSALSDPHPGVRRQAIRLAETRFGGDEALGPALLAAVDDPDVAVRFQLAMSLGEWDDPRAAEALATLAVARPLDDWVAAAILSSARGKCGPILAAVTAPGADDAVRARLLSPLIATLVGSGVREQIAEMTTAVSRPESDGSYPPWRLSALAELLDSGRWIDIREGERFGPILRAARTVVETDDAPAVDRVAAVRLLGRGEGPQLLGDRDLLIQLLSPRNPKPIQSAAIRGLIRLADEASTSALLENWGALEPDLQGECLDELLARPALASALVDAMERGAIAPAEMRAAHRQRLLEHTDGAVRARAAKMLDALPGRQAVVDTHLPLVERKGDAIRGESVFTRICAGCHRLAGKGHEVGPDLAALTDKSPATLAVAILDPNREVDARYVNVVAALKDGRVLTGLIASEIGDAITLKRQDGHADVVLRSELESLKTLGRSLMPEGLENDLKGTDLADLAAYIAGPPKSVEGNRPRLIVQSEDGSVRLAADSAEIHGASLTFEPEFANLGLWHGDDDHAAWSIRIDKPTSFTIAMEWACADEAAGNRFRMLVGDRKIEGLVGGTGASTWANYRSIFIGEVDLPPGVHRLDFRPARPIRGALLDLRAIVLSPRSS